MEYHRGKIRIVEMVRIGGFVNSQKRIGRRERDGVKKKQFSNRSCAVDTILIFDFEDGQTWTKGDCGMYFLWVKFEYLFLKEMSKILT